MSDRTPAEALARARWDRELEPDHPWYVAWDDASPRLRQEQVEFAEADIELLAAAGFRVSSKPDDDTRRLVTPLVVAVDRLIDRWAESDDAVRTELWQAMAKASAELAEATGVYPL